MRANVANTSGSTPMNAPHSNRGENIIGTALLQHFPPHFLPRAHGFPRSTADPLALSRKASRGSHPASPCLSTGASHSSARHTLSLWGRAAYHRSSMAPLLNGWMQPRTRAVLTLQCTRWTTALLPPEPAALPNAVQGSMLLGCTGAPQMNKFCLCLQDEH